MSEIKEVEIQHPLEKEFDIEEGTTIIEKVERKDELVVSESYDEKDNEIENQFQEVYEAAMAAFEEQLTISELVEGKYKARNMEVGVQLLNAALSAAKEKANLKQHKDKLDVKKAGVKTVNNNLIVADRNDILKSLLNNKN